MPVMPAVPPIVDTEDGYGGFDYSFQWDTTGAPTANGHIIQRVTRTESMDGGANVVRSYWEAWPVQAGNVMDYTGQNPLGGAAHDSWVSVEDYNRVGHFGTCTMAGDVYWAAGAAFVPAVEGYTVRGVADAGPLLSFDSPNPPTCATVLQHQHNRQWQWDARPSVPFGLTLLAQWVPDTIDTADEAIDELTDARWGFDNATANATITAARNQGMNLP